MIIPLKKEEKILTEEQKERIYWDQIKHDSHKWVEFKQGYFRCEFCDLIHTSIMPVGVYKMCQKNPHLK